MHNRLAVVALWLAWSAALGGRDAAAQVPIEPQPDGAHLAQKYAEVRARGRLGEAALLALKPGAVAATLAADLQVQDWLQIGAWSYTEGKFGPSYRKDTVCQYDLTRYRRDGGELRFSLADLCGAVQKPLLRHTNFTLPPHIKVAVAGRGADTWLAVDAYGVREWHRVVSYQQGVLVVDITFTGKKADKKVRFREVRLAVPRLYGWAQGEGP